MCSLFSNSVLQCSYAEQPRTMAVAGAALKTSVVSLTNNSDIFSGG